MSTAEPLEGLDGQRKRAVGALSATVISLANAVLFEALTVIATQDKTVRAASPWQDDPFDAMVSFAQFTVPAVCVVLALRLPLWRLPDCPDRVQQVLRAALVVTTLVTVTLGFEWAAVGARAHHAVWDGITGGLVAGLLVSSAATVSAVFCLTRAGAFYRSRSWTHDWLGDAFVGLARVPGLRKFTTRGNAELVRRHGVLVFAGASAIGAVLIVAALAVGERWTNPLLIGWALVVEVTSNFAFCMISNAVVGFIAYPTRSRRRHAVETAITAGCVAIQVAVTFRDPLWRALGGGTSVTSVADLILLTDGAGVLVGLIAFAFLLRRQPPAPRPRTAVRHDIGA